MCNVVECVVGRCLHLSVMCNNFSMLIYKNKEKFVMGG
jgi:hypothetical protein